MQPDLQTVYSAGSQDVAAQQNKVLRNTYLLLAVSLIPTVIGAVALSCLSGFALATYKFKSNLFVFFMFVAGNFSNLVSYLI